jgi:hypothetical protein
MRHRLRVGGPSLTPAAGSRGMLEPPDTAVLVTSTGFSLQCSARRRCASAGTVALPSITVAADQDLHAATRAKEEPSRSVPHVHPSGLGRGRAALDGIVH